MKKAIILLCISLAILGSGCAAPAKEVDLPPPSTKNDALIISPTQPPAPPATDLSTHALLTIPEEDTLLSEDGTPLFSHSYQRFHVILSDAQIADLVEADLNARADRYLQDAQQIREAALSDYDPQGAWTPYHLRSVYTPIRIDQKVISIYSTHQSYQGDPHPSQSTGSITYDATTGIVLTLQDLLAEDSTVPELLPLLLRSLEPHAPQLYEDYATILQDRFTTDPSSIGNWYLSPEGLCFHYAPYAIAPPASGIITALIPYHTLDGLLDPMYLPTVSVATGSIYAALASEDTALELSLTDLTLDPYGKEIILYADAPVADLRIETGYLEADTYLPTHTVFVADTLCAGTGIRLTADLNEAAPLLRLTYRTGEQDIRVLLRYDATANKPQLT